MSGRVLVLGSLNVDLVTRVERHPGRGRPCSATGLERLAGGKGANQAVAAAAAGARVAMVGCVGDDAAAPPTWPGSRPRHRLLGAVRVVRGHADRARPDHRVATTARTRSS